MDWLVPPLRYRETGPIYPLVLSYLAQIHGFAELAARGMRLTLAVKSPAEIEHVLGSLPARDSDLARRVLAGGTTELIDQPALASLVDQPVKIDVARFATEVFNDSEPAIRHFNLQSAGALIVLSWEHTQSIHTPDPLWEFLRHLRNAVAHGGMFHFLGREPARSASWRTKVVTGSLNNTPVFAAPVSNGFLAIGDVLHLLADIDAAFVR